MGARVRANRLVRCPTRGRPRIFFRRRRTPQPCRCKAMVANARHRTKPSACRACIAMRSCFPDVFQSPRVPAPWRTVGGVPRRRVARRHRAPVRPRHPDEFFCNDVLTLKKTVIRFRRKQTPALTSEQTQRANPCFKTDVRPSDQNGGCRRRSLRRNAIRCTHDSRRATHVPGFLCPPKRCACIAPAVGSVAPGFAPCAGWPSRVARGRCFALGYTPIDTDEEPLTWP